jgi:hypothetical protein
MWNIWETGEVHRECWWGDMRKKNHFEVLGVDGRIILKCIFKTWDGEAQIGLIWLRIGTGGGGL